MSCIDYNNIFFLNMTKKKIIYNNIGSSIVFSIRNSNNNNAHCIL